MKHYVARCTTCDNQPPMPFKSEKKRDDWVALHREALPDHVIHTYEHKDLTAS